MSQFVGNSNSWTKQAGLTFRLSHTIAFSGLVSTPVVPTLAVIPGWFIPKVSAQTATIVEIWGRIDSTTPIMGQLLKNGVAAGGSYNTFQVGSAGKVVTSGNISITNGDYFQFIVLQQQATPAYNLSLSIVLEHTI